MALPRVAKASPKSPGFELSRDIYGFRVLPQHLNRYREYADIYKVEEAERSERWKHFLNTYNSFLEEDSDVDLEEKQEERNESGHLPIRTAQVNDVGTLETWNPLRHLLQPVERALSARIKSGHIVVPFGAAQKSEDNVEASLRGGSGSIAKGRLQTSLSEGIEEDPEEEFYDVERSDSVQYGNRFDTMESDKEDVSNGGLRSEYSVNESANQLTQELEALVREGVPMALRGELWQVFVGTKMRRIKGHYNALLTLLADGGGDSDGIGGLCSNNLTSSNYILSGSGILEKWTSQIEKDLPRTFPGHPALDEDGLNTLRRLLTAYARHNPDVGYCQAMNFFAALLLLMMAEENAFWTLAGIIDDYFEGYYSEKMLESQVDQLVFDELVREHFPKLVSHLDTLGVQVAWISGPWFLSIFVNILPWESVLRVWDVLLFEGNRSMLFRTGLALMELHGPAIMTTKDAGDAVAMLQSLAGATFDSSQLVLVACMGYQMVDAKHLQDLQRKHRPKVIATVTERSSELHMYSSHCSPTSNLYNCTNGSDLNHIPSERIGSVPENVVADTGKLSEHVLYTEILGKNHWPLTLKNGNVASLSEGEFVPRDATSSGSDTVDNEKGNAIDLLEQVKWLKVELCRVLEENKAATLRAEELETAFMELVQEDNRRLLSAKIETLEAEVASLKQSLIEKEEQERTMVQVVLKMEQEQRLTEDARRFAEQDAAAQRHAVYVLQEKYEDTLCALAEMEKRAIMAESMLEATLQYQALGHGRNSDTRGGAHSSVREEDTSRRLWSRKPFSTGAANSDRSTTKTPPSVPHKSDSSELSRQGANTGNQGDPSRKQGLLSRPFGGPWRDREKTGLAELQPLKTSFVHENQPDTLASPQKSCDNISEDNLSYLPKELVADEMVHLNGSITSTEDSHQKAVVTEL